ncbi:MAG: signal peptidase II, partial [Clostridia bacterium]|nr:signal peptidase II [Clostridia bacterium]
AIVVLNALKRPKTSWLFRWSMLLLISGGLGNLVDRVFCDGVVRDFIQYLFLDGIFQKLFNTSFGVGNVADIYLVLGVFMICAYIVFDYKEGDLGILKIKKAQEKAVADSTDNLPANSAQEDVEKTPNSTDGAVDDESKKESDDKEDNV